MPLALLMRPTVLLALVLLLSLGANVGLWKMYKGQIERVGSVKAERDSALAVGAACSASVVALEQAAAIRAKRVRAALLKSEADRILAERKVVETLQLRPSNPASMCESAEVLIDVKVKERKK